MKWVFNLYVQTLIDWGDLLFRQNTLERINLATLRYVMAAKLLGRASRSDSPPVDGGACHRRLRCINGPHAGRVLR